MLFHVIIVADGNIEYAILASRKATTVLPLPVKKTFLSYVGSVGKGRV